MPCIWPSVVTAHRLPEACSEAAAPSSVSSVPRLIIAVDSRSIITDLNEVEGIHKLQLFDGSKVV